MNTFNLVQEMLMEELEIPADRITLDTTLAALAIDSLELLELLYRLEERLNIDLSSDTGPIYTVADMVSEIDRIVTKKSAVDE